MPAPRGQITGERSLAPLSRAPRTRPVRDSAAIRAAGSPQSILRPGLVFAANMTGNLGFTGSPIADTPGFPSAPRCSPWPGPPALMGNRIRGALRHDHDGHR